MHRYQGNQHASKPVAAPVTSAKYSYFIKSMDKFNNCVVGTCLDDNRNMKSPPALPQQVLTLFSFLLISLSEADKFFCDVGQPSAGSRLHSLSVLP